MKPIIEPHIHMYSRTTNDYEAMYAAGIRACLEPSFWMGANRRYAGTFFDYFQLILEFETVRARRFGIDHFAAVSLNPKEAEDRGLADDVIDGLAEYLDHPRCVALGEIGFNNITPNEEHAFSRQLEIARARGMVVIVHTPHVNKLEGTIRIAEILKNMDMDVDKVVVDHNTEETIEVSRNTGCYCGMTVYPISKLTPSRVSEMIRSYGSERMIVNGSADWGVSDPLSLVKVVDYMRGDGHTDETIENLLYNNPMAFYGGSDRWKPELDLEPVAPETFQR
ncbi:MAG: TatD family hydrolase [Kiritimatiellia bacterium]|nr:TatD family hydrolase [Kiritimatiellia bacterium]MDP6847408.1 TatD family hydrolase [Kiritimatiellia bacterium]